MKELDNLHYDYSSIDGYNKPFNFIMSPREPGKTTMAWLKKIYFKWKTNKRPWIYLTRTAVEITEAMITSIQDTTINKFTDDNVIFKYTKGSFKDGIVDVFIGDEIFFRVVSLSIPLRRIKLAVLKNIGGVLMDEYIINPKTNERYIKNEAFIIKEAYTTWRREANGMLKCYFLANPYSLFNPLFLDWNVDVSALKRDSFYVGDNFVIHWAILNPLLKEKILKENPLYQFDEDYNNYALEGVAINDSKIPLSTLPRKFQLRFVFRIMNRLIGVFYNVGNFNNSNLFHCKVIDSISINRDVFCFDISELVERTIVMSGEEALRMRLLKNAMRTYRCTYEDINVYYMMMEVFKQI